MQKFNDDSKSKKSYLSIRKLCKYLKKYFVPWVVVSAVSAVLVGSIYSIDAVANRTISATVNFSFDGVESGHDPLGNKFDVNEIKSKEAVQKAIDELGLKDVDADEVCSSITILGDIPTDVIERITEYKSMYGDAEISTVKNVRDTTYYPTQYRIEMDCHKLDLDFDDCVSIMKNITESYQQTFSVKYGYKDSLANVIEAFDYKDYDYGEAINIFDSSLESLQSYVNSLAAMDDSRFSSIQTGYTFSDLANSIQTLRSENLEIISSYITFYNMTKDKEYLMKHYEYRIDDLKRRKKVDEEKLEALKNTLEVYEKNSVLVFAQSTNGADATLNEASDTYDNLVGQVVYTESDIERYQQQINKYNDRIKNLKENKRTGSVEKLEKDFEVIEGKIKTLLENVEVTVSEYYTNVEFVNAYEILKPVSDSTFETIFKAIKKSLDLYISIEFFIIALYFIVAMLSMNSKLDNLSLKLLKGSKDNKSKLKKNKGGKK